MVPTLALAFTEGEDGDRRKEEPPLSTSTMYFPRCLELWWGNPTSDVGFFLVLDP